ncbi:helix-turn-helix domain-containing protein [Sphaerisporangium fuscum]|uniref:helix-turn-helix domain-containing protein n=1 Tax=Sphaerisporangium fuscum TaxID=2835868 RepID=UPI001BDBE878|nr:helix-turn-helix transcriptional regulator [Sphaerisporangium fuscum]
MARPELELHPERSARDRFGFELRSWRKARGLSQARLGAKVHVSGDLVRLIEVAERWPARDFAERCDQALDTVGALVRLWETVEAERRQSMVVADSGAHTDKPLVGTDRQAVAMAGMGDQGSIVVQMMNLTGEPVAVSMDRRTFMSGIAALPAVAWIDQRGTGRAGLPATVAEGDLRDVLTNMRKLFGVLATQDNILGPSAVAPTAVHQVAILRQLSRTASGRSRAAVMDVQAAYAEFTGWLADDLGDRNAGQHWITNALQWAHEAGDDLFVGYVLMRQSQRAGEVGDTASAIGLGQAAQHRGESTNRVLAAASQAEAQGHALAGDEKEFRAAIERARGLVAGAPQLVPGDWAPWCTPAYIDIHEAAGWTRLGEPRKAIVAYEGALKSWPGEFQRDQGIYLGRLAQAYAAAGEPEQSAQRAATALGIARLTNSARIVAELTPLRSTLDRWQGLPTVKEFLSDLRQSADQQ